MAYTMQQVVDRGRFPLNDAAKRRYKDADLLGFANAAIFRAFELRPDLRIGSGWADFSSLTLGQNFPLADRFMQTVADYVTGRAEMRDDEAVNSGRAVQLMKLFAAELVQ